MLYQLDHTIPYAIINLLNTNQSMCLVSFVPLKDRILITSSRDENVGREKPVLVHDWIRNKKSLSFPQDVKGGTWIGYDDFNNFLVLLNGARTKHKRAAAYRKSRGLIVLDLLDAEDILAAWQAVDLTDIEPFTLLHYSSKGDFWEWVWDGQNKITTQLDTKLSHCWLSSTLYTPQEWAAMKVKFQASLPELKTRDAIRSFHLENRYETKLTGLVIPSIKTVSNTTVEFKGGAVKLDYLDVREGC